MKDKKDKFLYIFLHLPKTGGSTIRKHISKNYSEKEAILLSYPKLRFSPYQLSYKKLFTQVENDISKLSEREKANVKVLYGEEVPFGVHKLFKRKAKYITVFREPQKRTLSLYNFYRTRYEKDKLVGRHRSHYDYQFLIDGKAPLFHKWLKEKYAVKKNSTETVWQLLDLLGYLNTQRNKKFEIEKCLKKFFFIGLTESSKEDFLYIYHLLGINKFFMRQNVSKKYYNVPFKKDIGKMLDIKNNQDKLLYKTALQANSDFKQINKGFNKAVRKMKLKKLVLLPVTQVIFDFKGLLTNYSALLKEKSEIYSAIMNLRKGV